MRKYLFLILFGIFAFVPQVHASTVSRAFTGTAEWYQQQGYYYGRPDNHNGINGGFLSDDTETKSFPSNGSYYLLRPIDTNVNFIYALKQLVLRSNVSVESGKVYSVQLMFAKGSYVRFGNEFDTSLYNISNDSECITNVGSCSYEWNNEYAIITLVPNQNSSNYYIRLGNQANYDKALALNTYTMGSQGIEIRSSSIQNSDNAIDITPMVNQQQQTNQKLDNINNNINNTNNKIDDVNLNLENINDVLSDDNSPSSTDINNNFTNYDVISNGPISALLQIPLRVLNALNNAVNNNVCRTYTFGTLYNHEIYFPCIDIESIVGSDLFTVIDYIFSIIILYNVFLLVIHFFESITSFKDMFDELYVPKHAYTGYKPKHGGGD